MRNLSKQLLSFILPFNALVIVPLLIEHHFSIVIDPLFWLGVVCALAGLAMLTATVIMFIRIGRGTLAPWSPTRKLVVEGLYAHVRNPMITGVLIGLIGETLIFHSVPLAIWVVAFFSINHIYFITSEEPGLASRFGEEYQSYKENVPRWIPRVTPWIPGTGNPRT